MTASLEIRHLEKRYRTATVLNDLSLDVAEGEVLSVVGPSGCGKSTLLRLIAGLDKPDAGTIRAGGRLLAGAGIFLPPERRGLNMVFQDYALWPHMKVGKIVGYGLARLGRAEREGRVNALLDLMQIGQLADRFPAQISGGQQQRVVIARALATDPSILLFDEPLSNLDVQLRVEMRQEFAELFARLGKTVVYVTHDPQEAYAFADRLLVMRHGQVEQLGPPQELFARPQSPWVASLAGYDSRIGAILGRPLRGTVHEVWVGRQRMAATLRGAGGALPEQTPLTLMLHPSSILIANGDGHHLDETVNSLKGIVRNSIYEGRQWRLRLEVGGASALSLVASHQVEVGSCVEVAFPVEDTLAFPGKGPVQAAGAGA